MTPPLRTPEQKEIIDNFARLYYEAGEYDHGTWRDTFWMGARVAKYPMDLWVYQEIMVRTRPDVIIETGTFVGGSALYMASIFDLMGTDGRIVTVDIQEWPGRPVHPRIQYVIGSSVDGDVAGDIGATIGPTDRVMVILDSDHSQAHVEQELDLYNPWVTPGCYLIVEDTTVNGHPVMPDFGPGPMEALDTFLAQTNEFVIDHEAEKFFLTQNPRGFLRKVDPMSGTASA